MHVGMGVVFQNPGNALSDAEVWNEEVAMALEAEELGYESIWSVEHHFTDYTMCPDPVQFLTYLAGRTSRVQFGTGVIVLPWHDPVRVAEQIALLDIMCGGRCLFGFGRGAATTEYDGFRVPMGEARPRFAEAAQIIVKALSQESFEHDGEFFKIPRMSIRPRPISHPEQRFYASSVSPESAELIAKLGFGMLMIMQNEWAKCRADIDTFQAMSSEAGFTPKPPIILTNCSVAESREEARERAVQFLGRKWQSIDEHYRFSDGHLANIKGYEAYGKTAKTYAKLKDPENLKKSTDFYVSIQIVGTPDDCLQQIAELRGVTGMEHMVAEFSFGNLPHHQAERNIRLFADRVLPTLQHDKAFAGPAVLSTAAPKRASHEGIFAPA